MKNNLSLNYKIFKKVFFIMLVIIFLIFIVSLIIIKPKLNNISNSIIILDDNGQKIGELLQNNNIRHEYVKVSEIPSFSKKVIISIEDRSFNNNIGIDFSAIFRAIKSNILKQEIIEGASTISTQVIRNNYWLNSDRTFLRKIMEFYLAISLNIHYSKDIILESYLNNIYFGNLNYGINSASKYYFGKELNNLTKAEQIALLIIPKNPVKYSPIKNKANFENRFANIVKYLEKNSVITPKEKNEIENEKLVFNLNNQIKLPYVIDFLKSYTKINNNDNKKNIIKTTIDYNLTQKVDELARNSITPIRWKGVGDYGILIVDRKTNEIKVLIGGEDYSKEGGQVNSVLALRQPGSSIKPFTYLLAFRELGLTPESTILDEPVQFFTDKGYAYTPENYSLDYKGKVNLAEALSQSINIPAIKLTNKVGVKNLLNFLKEVGITSLNKDSDYYGLALTLGVGEVSLYELLRSYSIFANDGNLCDFKVIEDSQSKNCKKVVEKKYIDMVETILTNRYFKLSGFPINSSLDFADRYVFVKTGTSRNFNDNWAIGFTDNNLIGVWVGNKDGEEMKGVSGASGAGEIFRNIVYQLENREYYGESIELKQSGISFLEITSPLDGSLYKIDNTKSLEIQNIKLDFATNIDYNNYFWQLNGKRLDKSFFNIKEGIHELSLNLEYKGKIVGSKKVKIKVEN